MIKRLIKLTLILALLFACPSLLYAAPPLPTIIVGFPLNGAYYNNTSWSAAGKISGTAQEYGSEVITQVRLYIIRNSDGKYWDGTIWTSGGSVSATLTSPGSISTGWSYSFASLTDGSYTVRAQAFGGEWSAVEERIFTYDNTPPQNPTITRSDPEGIQNNVWTNIGNAGFYLDDAYDATSGIDRYDYDIIVISEDGFSAMSVMSGYTTSNSIDPNIAPLGSDTYYIRLRTKDHAGNLAPWVTLFTWKYDGTPPASFNLIYPAASSGTIAIPTATPTFSWQSSSDLPSGKRQYELVLDPSSDPTILSTPFILGPSATSFTPTFALGEGYHTYYVECRDNAGTGNTTRASGGSSPTVPGAHQFYVDLTAPQVNLTSPVGGQVTNNPTINLTGNISDNYALRRIEILVNGTLISAPTFAGDSTNSYDINTSLDLSTQGRIGSNIITVNAYDTVGRIQSSNREITYDPNAPHPFSLDQPANGALFNNRNVQLSWIAPSDDLTSIAGYDVYIDGSKINGSLINSTAYTPPALTERAHSWKVIAYDTAGNAAESSTWNFTVDITPPQSFSLIKPAEGGLLDVLNFEWEVATDSLSGLAGYDLYIDDNKFMSVTTNSALLSETPADGRHCFFVEAKDRAGNVTRSATRNFIINNNGPEIIVSVDGVPLINGSTLRSVPTINTVISDFAGVDQSSLKFMLDGAEIINLSVRALAVNQCEANHTLSSRLKSGLHTIRVEARDSYGVLSIKEISDLLVEAKAEVTNTPKNYPNPFRPFSEQTTSINYTLLDDTDIKINIYDLSGRPVLNKICNAGTEGGRIGENNVIWDGKSYSGDILGNGVYIYLITSSGSILSSGEISIYE
jgi:hypothetical protein